VKRRDILENQVNRAYLSIGSNLGKKIYNLEKTKYLLDLYGINILKVSSLYQTKSWPNKSFPDYINTVFLVKTYLNLTDLFKKLKFIEKIMGRIDAPKNFPRICDIDIIDYNGKWRNISYLGHKIEVPHAKMHQRNFVLVPLYEINRNWIHPKFKKNIVKLISSLSTKDLRTIKLS
tara:strand:- start:1684 stop:2211 length:528 start_codon:yes stop_codon:yes gene_type:complete